MQAFSSHGLTCETRLVQPDESFCYIWLTHSGHDHFVIDERDVEDEAGQDEQRSVQVLDFGIVDDRPDH